MPNHLPSLNAIRVFEVAARHLSLVRAAEELHVTHGAVSRQIKQLEENLGVELFERRNRAIFLTRAGLSLQGTCTDIMRQLEAGLRQLRQMDDQPLVVSCEPTIAMRWLIPRLGKFRELHPELEIHLFAAGGPVDLRHGHIDLALRRNDFAWDANYHVATVARELIAPVCTPGLLKQGKLALNQQCLLHTATRPDAWSQWQKLSRQLSKQTTRGKSRANYEHFYLSLQAACAGLGVAMASAYMVEDEIHSGQLIAPHAFMEDGTDYVLLSALPFGEDQRRLRFLEWLQQELEVTARAVIPACF